MLEQLRTIISSLEVFQKGLHVCSTLAVVLSPDSPTPLTSAAMGASHQQSPGPSASLLVTEETLGNIYRVSVTPQPAAEQDIRMEHGSD
jgi:hypothetical protein